LFDRITRQIDAAATGNYPPYDIVVTGDSTYEIRVAAAGFRLEEINIEYHEGQLAVTGTKDATPDHEYLHHGISNRSWVRSWTLADYVEVKAAVMKDGILTIKLERIVPETMKPKKIEISYQS
jgi:molecular chaperone IbpA